MIGRPGTWAEVGEGVYVRDVRGETWRVDGIDGQMVRLTSKASTPMTMLIPPPDAPVMILEPSMADATQLLATTLGAKKIHDGT